MREYQNFSYCLVNENALLNKWLKKAEVKKTSNLKKIGAYKILIPLCSVSTTSFK